MNRNYRGRRGNNLGLKASSLYFLNDISNINELNENNNSQNWKDLYTLNHDLLGRGHFSKVYKAKCCSTGNTVAVKVIRRRRRGNDKLDEIMREVEMMQMFNRSSTAGVIHLIEYHVTNIDVAMVMEFAMGGSIYNVVTSSSCGLPDVYCRIIMAKLLTALNIIHCHDIVHLDIKADNIILKHPYPSTDAVICDFGVARKLDKNQVHRELVGTPDYIAPEVSNYEQITYKSDMWSMGVLCYFLLTKISPFLGSTKEETMSQVTRAQFEFKGKLLDENARLARNFISKLLNYCPEKRMSAAESLNDEFLSSVSVLDLSLGGMNHDNNHDISKAGIPAPSDIPTVLKDSDILPADEIDKSEIITSEVRVRKLTGSNEVNNLRNLIVSQYEPPTNSEEIEINSLISPMSKAIAMQSSMLDLLKFDEFSASDDIKRKSACESSISDCYKDLNSFKQLINEISENQQDNDYKNIIEMNPIVAHPSTESIEIMENPLASVEHTQELQPIETNDDITTAEIPIITDESHSLEISSLTPFTDMTTELTNTTETNIIKDDSLVLSTDLSSELTSTREQHDENASSYNINTLSSSYDISSPDNYKSNSLSESNKGKENKRPESMIETYITQESNFEINRFSTKFRDSRRRKQSHQKPNMLLTQRCQSICNNDRMEWSDEDKQNILRLAKLDDNNQQKLGGNNTDSIATNSTLNTAMTNTSRVNVSQLKKSNRLSRVSLRKDSDFPMNHKTNSSHYLSQTKLAHEESHSPIPSVSENIAKQNVTSPLNTMKYPVNHDQSSYNSTKEKNQYKSQPNLTSTLSRTQEKKSTLHRPSILIGRKENHLMPNKTNHQSSHNLNSGLTSSDKNKSESKSMKCVIS